MVRSVCGEAAERVSGRRSPGLWETETHRHARVNVQKYRLDGVEVLASKVCNRAKC